MYSADPLDIDVPEAQRQIEALERHRSRLRRDRHPLAALDSECARRAIHDLSLGIAYTLGRQ